MAKSIGEAISIGTPIVFTRDGMVPEVVCEPGKEKEALDLMHQLKLILLIRPQAGNKPNGAIQTFLEESEKTDVELLKENGWTVECVSPLEIRHEDGSFGCGRGATDLLRYLRSRKK